MRSQTPEFRSRITYSQRSLLRSRLRCPANDVSATEGSSPAGRNVATRRFLFCAKGCVRLPQLKCRGCACVCQRFAVHLPSGSSRATMAHGAARWIAAAESAPSLELGLRRSCRFRQAWRCGRRNPAPRHRGRADDCWIGRGVIAAATTEPGKAIAVERSLTVPQLDDGRLPRRVSPGSPGRRLRPASSCRRPVESPRHSAGGSTGCD